MINLNNYDYVLNFVIPQGPAGSTGPVGPISLDALISLHYNNTTTSGILTIASNFDRIILPKGSDFFTVNEDNIIINETGYYEFIFYGLLKDNSSTTKSNLSLIINDRNLIDINLSNETDELYFSRTIVTKCNDSETITILFNNQSSGNASVENVYLLVKKLYF